MGNVFKGPASTTNTTTNTSTSPNAAMTPYLTAGLNTASGIMGSQEGSGFYGGPLYAGLNPQQLSALQGLNSFAAGPGAAAATGLMGAGGGAVSGIPGGLDAAKTVFGSSQSNPTANNIANAGLYANNPTVAGMIKAANDPVQNNLVMGTLPGLYGTAAATGNTDSSRTGTQAAIQTALATQQEANNAANIEGAAYNNGLNMSNNDWATGLSAGNAAANTMVGAGTAGAGALGSGYQMGVNNLNIPLQTGTTLQQDQQAQDQAAYQQWQGQTNYPWQVLQNYWNIAGNPNLLGTTGTSQTNGTVQQGGPGVLGGLLGTAAGIGSFFAPTGAFGTNPSMFSSLTNGIGNLFKSSQPTSNTGGLY